MEFRQTPMSVPWPDSFCGPELHRLAEPWEVEKGKLNISRHFQEMSVTGFSKIFQLWLFLEINPWLSGQFLRGEKKFYLPNNLIFCSKMPLLGFALLHCFLQWRTKYCYFLKTSAAPYWITWIPHPTPMPCLSVLAQTWKNIFFWSNNLHEWYFKPQSADKGKEQSVSMLWEQFHGFGVVFLHNLYSEHSPIQLLQ